MKIATWNIERLKHKKDLDAIVTACKNQDAEILVLTEADERVHLEWYPFCYATLPPCKSPVHYAPTERRVIIHTKYPCVRQHETYDNTTAICVELETERGNLLVYGSIIGIYGHRKPFFMDEMNGQMKDLRRLATQNLPICFLGDYNCSFADNYYSSSVGRSTILNCFAETGMKLLTANMPACIDHIAISEGFIGAATTNIDEWNQDKSLSDHKGTAVSFHD